LKKRKCFEKNKSKTKTEKPFTAEGRRRKDEGGRRKDDGGIGNEEGRMRKEK